MRIATWNVNSLKARVPRVEEWLDYAKPDVLCLQETKLKDADFPIMAFEALGYEVAFHGGGRWNGVAIASRVGLDDVVNGFTDDVEDEEIESRALWATCGGVRVCSVYVPNGRALDDPHYKYKLEWLARLLDMLKREHSPSEKIAILGDYNIAPSDDDVWDIKKFNGATHVSEPEREAFRALLDWGFHDSFRERLGDQRCYTYWDYRAGNFHKGFGMRIDHILLTSSLNEKVTYELVDRNARKGTAPSDHAPLFVDLSV